MELMRREGAAISAFHLVPGVNSMETHPLRGEPQFAAWPNQGWGGEEKFGR